MGYWDEYELKEEIEQLKKVLDEIEIRSDKNMSDFNILDNCQINLAQIYNISTKGGGVKVYILKDSDFQKLLDNIDRNPTHGRNGGSSQVLNQQERRAYNEAHRFYNYHIRTWIQAQKEE